MVTIVVVLYIWVLAKRVRTPKRWRHVVVVKLD